MKMAKMASECGAKAMDRRNFIKTGTGAFAIASEQIESAYQHDGWYSVRSYDFNGKALTHKISDVKKTYD